MAGALPFVAMLAFSSFCVSTNTQFPKLETKLKDAKDYLSQLRSVTAVLNKAIDSCQKQIDIAPKPNPIWSRTLKIHLKGLRRIQKSLPNMIKIFDEQIKKYEEDSKKSVKV